MKHLSIYAPSLGKVVKLSDLNERIPNNGYDGVGIGFYPDGDVLYSPVTGTIKEIAEYNNSIKINTECGLEISVKFGLDTYRLKGRGMGTYVKVGDKVEDGDKLLFFDRNYVSKISSLTTVITILNPDIITNQEENIKGFYSNKGRLIMSIKIEEETA